MFDELSPPYSTIVADPPWHYDEMQKRRYPEKGLSYERMSLAYSTLSVDEIAALPVEELAAPDAHLYVWTTNRYLPATFDIVKAWGFRYAQTLVWAKTPHGITAGGAYTNSAEFCIFARRGSPGQLAREDSTWWHLPRGAHSAKPPAFLDMVERVSPGPRLELFARATRFGWDSWGHGYELGVTA